MVTGWYVVQAPTDGTFAATGKKALASIQASAPQYGPMQTTLKPYSIAMQGWVPTGGPIAATAKQALANFTKQYTEGSVLASLKKSVASLGGQVPHQGNIAAASKKATLSAIGIQSYDSVLAAAYKKMAANFNATQTQAGAIAAATPKAAANLSGSHTQAYGSMGATAKKTAAAANGAVLFYHEFTPTGNTLDTWWSNPGSSVWPNISYSQANGEIQSAVPGWGGFGQPVYHFFTALNYTAPVSSSEHFIEAVMGGNADGGDYGMFLYIGGEPPETDWTAMVYAFNASGGKHGWFKRNGPAAGNFTSATTWSNSPARPSVPVGGKCKVTVRKSGNDWIYEAWVNGVKVSGAQATFTDVNGATNGTPGKYVGIGQWSDSWAFGAARGNGTWKGPFRIGDGQG